MAVPESCPYCGAPISHAKLVEIESAIRLEEQKKFDSAKRQWHVDQQRDLQLKVQAARAEAQQQARVEASALVAANQALEKRAKAAEQREASVRKQCEADALQQLQKDRRAIEQDRDLVILKKEAEFNREREALQKKLKVVEHQLQKKTANELGDGLEINLYEELRSGFQSDRIKRVPKGVNGADIIHEVIHNGKSCGSIIIDCKHRQSWQDSYTTKLRQDQVDARAEHAILSSTVFPSRQREMCVISNVIVVSPARVVYMVEVLRRTMVAMHIQGLSIQERGSKTERLYELMTSDSYRQRFSQAVLIADQMLDLDVDEKKAHDAVWKKRGILGQKTKSLLRDLDTDISSIIEALPTDTPSRKAPLPTQIARAPGELRGTGY
jgi:hypothetical protein